MSACEYLSDPTQRVLRDHILVLLAYVPGIRHLILPQLELKDIEELVRFGKQQRACPYYGARRALPLAEVSIFLVRAFSSPLPLIVGGPPV